MTSGTPYIGSKISLVSKAEIRYEGFLYTIDQNDSTVTLAKVISLGTEDRVPESPVPAREEVFEYIVFRGSDIKDLHVCEGPKQPNKVQDPAIVHHSSHSSHSYSQINNPYYSRNYAPFGGGVPSFGYHPFNLHQNSPGDISSFRRQTPPSLPRTPTPPAAAEPKISRDDRGAMHKNQKPNSNFQDVNRKIRTNESKYKDDTDRYTKENRSFPNRLNKDSNNRNNQEYSDSRDARDTNKNRREFSDNRYNRRINDGRTLENSRDSRDDKVVREKRESKDNADGRDQRNRDDKDFRDMKGNKDGSWRDNGDRKKRESREKDNRYVNRDKEYVSRDKEYVSRDKEYVSSRDKEYVSNRDKEYVSSRDKEYVSSRDKEYANKDNRPPRLYNYVKKENQEGKEEQRSSSEGGRGQFRGRGRGSGGRRGNGRGSSRGGNTQTKFTEDFDFETANAKFNKEEIEKELLRVLKKVKIKDETGENSELKDVIEEKELDDSAPLPSPDKFYDRSKSFFDSISCEAMVPKTDEEVMTRRQEQALNTETFGSSASRFRPGYRGRGRGRGRWRGRGRGGFYRGRGSYRGNSNRPWVDYEFDYEAAGIKNQQKHIKASAGES